jgi:hypothetical protein
MNDLKITPSKSAMQNLWHNIDRLDRSVREHPGVVLQSGKFRMDIFKVNIEGIRDRLYWIDMELESLEIGGFD